MHPLSANGILQVWEQGYDQHLVNRALTLLAATCQEMTWNELAELSVGQRDALLLTLREQTFGNMLNVFTECPQCHDHIEFTTNVADIRVVNHSDTVQKENELSVENFDIRFRLLNSLDLGAVVKCNDLTAARNFLVHRCVLQASSEGKELSSGELPENIIEKLAERLAECDPQSEVLLNIVCPSCSHNWHIIFDIVFFFWKEISMQAKRLLHEVHILASAYGWQESDILSLSAARRQFYLEMVS
jgi:hypothetical protein